MHYLLFYEAGSDYEDRRAPFRAAHLAHARQAVERGELVLGGGVGTPAEGAVLLFQGASSWAAEAFAASDPYVVNGVITSWRVRPWATVVGRDAATPL